MSKYRETTLRVLRITFLSALTLELLATLSTAVVAVEIGLRLLYSQIGFEQAFFILLLAPEFYQPMRALGARYHAGMSGVSAAKRIYEVLDTPETERIETVIRQSSRNRSSRWISTPPAGGHFCVPQSSPGLAQESDAHARIGEDLRAGGAERGGKIDPDADSCCASFTLPRAVSRLTGRTFIHYRSKSGAVGSVGFPNDRLC